MQPSSSNLLQNLNPSKQSANSHSPFHHFTLVLAEADECRQALTRSMLLRQNAHHIPLSAFESRKRFFQTAFQKGDYLKDPASRGQPAPNPLTDPGGMEQMMNMMKGNMVMFIPQTVIMGWINFFFSGFVLRMSPTLWQLKHSLSCSFCALHGLNADGVC